MRIAAAQEDIPGESAARLHAYEPRFRLVPAYCGGMGGGCGGAWRRDTATCPCLLPLLRAGGRDGLEPVRFCHGPVAAGGLLRRPARVVQADAFADHGNEADYASCVRGPCGTDFAVADISVAAYGREFDGGYQTQRRFPDRYAGRPDSLRDECYCRRRPQCGGLVGLLLRAGRILYSHAFLALHAHLHRGAAHFFAPVPAPQRPEREEFR